MDIIDAPQAVVPQTVNGTGKAQPVAALVDLDPTLDDKAVREALLRAEANGQDPMTATMEDLKAVQQGTVAAPIAQAPVVQANLDPLPVAQPVGESRKQAIDVLSDTPVDVPQKFLKPDGAVDVEKIKASTKQLDEAIQKKEEAIKSVDDYVSEYREKEKKFRNLPNVQNIQREIPQPQQPIPPAQMTNEQLEAAIRQDFQADPVLTLSRLTEAIIERRLEPIQQKEKEESVRSNISELVKKDSRVLQPEVFAAINAKLQSNPELWNLKNPHKAAWLEVKDEMRLGDPSQVPAQPSRTATPILGGGTPPSAPTVSTHQPSNVISSIDKLDLRDRRQEAMGDEAIRRMLAGGR